MSSSLSTIRTPSSFRRGGRPPRTDSPSSRKRRAAAAAGVRSSPSGRESVGSSSIVSEQSSCQLRPTHNFVGGSNLFGGFDDDLDNFAQYVKEEDDSDDEEDEEEGQEVSHRKVSFESDEETQPKETGMRRFFRTFDRKRKNQKQKTYSEPQEQQRQQQGYHFEPQANHVPIVSPHERPEQPLTQSWPQAHPSPFRLKRPRSTLSKSRDPPSLIVPSGNPTEILCTAPPTRSRSDQVDYRTYNAPQSTLPKIGSFDLDIDTIPASPRMTSVSPYTQDEDIERNVEEDRIVPRNPSWKSSSTGTTSLFGGETIDVSTAMVPYASGGVELVEAGSVTGSLTMPFSAIHRQGSWERRLERTDIYHRHYSPSRHEIGELQELEDYLGIFSAKTKHRFSTLWRQLVPPLDAARQRTNRRSTLQSQNSISDVSTLSSVTNHRPTHSSDKSKSPFYSIVLKRGPIQFEEYQDFHCEWILLTHGFVVARPNFQYIPRFQAGDMWTSVVQVQPTNPLSITLSCTSRSTSSHLTLTQLKQQQQYGCYTYEISCATPQEQASWLDALRRVVVQAHDAAGTNEKEMGGLGWQYRVVYVPFFTEAVTGNPVQKDKILAGSTGTLDLNALDSYSSYAPLHYATRANHVRVMSFLLEAGADVHVGDGYGRTPMYYAELHQVPEATIQLLEANGAQRTKKPVSGAAAAHEVWQKRNCWRKCFIAGFLLLLLACGVSALLWYFGVLEPLGIGGDKSANKNLDAPSLAVVDAETAQPSEQTTAPIPPLISRGVSTPEPTTLPSYIKTPLPAPETNARQTPPTESPSSTPSPPPTSAAYNGALFKLLEAASFDAGAAMRIPGSPQNLAFFWLLGNANLDSYTNNKKIQRYALATFYYSTNGDNWADNLWWLSDEDECMWFNKQVATGYSTCTINTSSAAQKTLTSLDLSFNNVQGTIPPELGLLSGLLRLDLDGGPAGFLTGPIPTELGYLNVIESFSARGNQLSGTLPTEIGMWELVRGIDLSFNKLTGLIPTSVGSMTWLTELTLEMNDFSGFLPNVELGKLRNLFKLALGGNQLSGPIPSEIGFLTKLRYLYLEANSFTRLPTQVGLLENLNVFSIFENNIEGALPSELGHLKKLGSLLMRSNAFNSPIPSEMGLMEQLQNTLDLSFNDLSGPIPSQLGNLTLLRSLYLQSNRLSGAIPNEVARLSNLNSFRVESNDIAGIVPADFCNVVSNNYPMFYADCDEVSCSCCTYCCQDNEGCVCEYANTNQAYLC